MQFVFGKGFGLFYIDNSLGLFNVFFKGVNINFNKIFLKYKNQEKTQQAL